MNFDKKIHKVYKEFLGKQKPTETKPKSPKTTTKSPRAPKDKTAQSLPDDFLFELPTAAKLIKEKDKDTEWLKRMRKNSKIMVLEQIEAREEQQRQKLYPDYDPPTPEPPETKLKRKLSPKTLDKIKTVTKKRIKDSKRDMIKRDDFKAMKAMTQNLIQFRKKEDKKMSKGLVLETSEGKMITVENLALKKQNFTENAEQTSLIQDVKVVKSTPNNAGKSKAPMCSI